MFGFLIALLVVWVVLAILGIAVKGLLFLFWIAIILIIVTAIGSILRYIRSRA